ncbi:MAG: hypothetical protein AAF230_06650 [Pseudomonadota bacterium]
MIWTFILGAIAGWGAEGAEDRLKPLVAQYLPGEAPGGVEMRAISLALCLFAASVIAVFSGGGSAVALALGGVLGVLGPRLYAKFKATRAPDYDS